MRIASFVLAGLMALVIAAPAQAQHGTLELGMDAGFVFTSPDVDGADNTFDISLPFQFVRAGFFVSDQFSIEPVLSFDRSDFGDDFTLTQLSLLGTGLYHFSADAGGPRFFLQGGGGLQYLSVSDAADSESDTQWLAGAGLGVKLPLPDRVAVRFSLLYLRAFESDFFPDANLVRGHVGLSFFVN